MFLTWGSLTFLLALHSLVIISLTESECLIQFCLPWLFIVYIERILVFRVCRCKCLSLPCWLLFYQVFRANQSNTLQSVSFTESVWIFGQEFTIGFWLTRHDVHYLWVKKNYICTKLKKQSLGTIHGCLSQIIVKR